MTCSTDDIIKERLSQWFNNSPHDMGKEEYDQLFKVVKSLISGITEIVELKDHAAELEFALALAKCDKERTINDAICLADALMDINNVLGEEEHVKAYVSEVDEIMREYHSMDRE